MPAPEKNPLPPPTVFGFEPFLVDIDNDGDLDLVKGVNIYDYYSESMGYETLRVIENRGSAVAPEFVLKEEVNNPYGDIRTNEVNLGDLDGDGDFDVLVFDYYSGGGMQFFELDNNTVQENRELIPEMYDGIILPFSYILSPQFVDYDGDGDLDIIAFAYGSKDFLKYDEYKDTGAQLKYAPVDNKSFGFINPDKEIQLPFFVDPDADSDLDLLAHEFYGLITSFYENTGPSGSPDFKKREIQSMDIYPNQVADVLHVNLENSETGTLSCEMISLESRQIQNGSTAGMGNITRFSIDTGYLLPGQYVLKVRSGERLYISKFLKL